MIVETHGHLADAQFDLDRDDVLARARLSGVTPFIEIGEEEPQWAKARALSESHPDVYWTAGMHPYYANAVDGALLDRLAQSIEHPRCVAVGEIGLDYHRDDSPRDVQRKALADLLAAAVRARKPVVLHCRESHPDRTEAQQDLLDILRSVKVPADAQKPAGVAHCFQGTVPMAQSLCALGYMIGVDAPLTYPKAGALREMVATVPLEHLVLETDSPYLPPQSHRGKRNEPAHLPAIARALADIKGVPFDTVTSVTSANARRLFRI
ncbi:MAG: TatD family hydrolase [Elusimicrobia bacterium]|nr:TatD family hydrolase [Elusimicrobiota bacterium]